MSSATSAMQVLHCAVCLGDCRWIDDSEATCDGGWWCDECECFSESDVELED